MIFFESHPRTKNIVVIWLEQLTTQQVSDSILDEICQFLYSLDENYEKIWFPPQELYMFTSGTISLRFMYLKLMHK